MSQMPNWMLSLERLPIVNYRLPITLYITVYIVNFRVELMVHSNGFHLFTVDWWLLNSIWLEKSFSFLFNHYSAKIQIEAD